MLKAVRIALFAVALAIPALTFAGGQPNMVRSVGKTAVPDRTGVSRTVNQGKGAGITRKQMAGNSPSQTVPRASGNDTAFAR
jgi:hypothetical protein